MLARLAGSWWTRLAITAAILAWLATRIDMAAAARAVVSVSAPHLLAVLALVAVDRAVMIWRWILLLRARGVPVGTGQAMRVFLISSFVGSFLPAGIGGDAARAWSLTRITSRAGEALASVMVDRLLGVLSLAAMGLAGVLAWAPAGGGGGRVVLAVAVLSAACVGAFWADALIRAVVPDARHSGAITRRLLRVADAMAAYRDHRGTLAVVMAWSIVVQVLRISQAYLLGLGLGLTAPFTYYLLFMPLGLLALLLPVSVSGFGVPQGVIVWLLRPQGVPEPLAFALSTLIVLTGLAGNLPGLWLYLTDRARSGDGPVTALGGGPETQ